MATGRVIKNYNGDYYVDIGENELIECRRRGKLKVKILVGDILDITALENHTGVIENILPRRNSIIRPAVANIDQMFIIMAAQSPDPNQFLLDKMLMTCEYGGIHPKICFNKCDLDLNTAKEYRDFYSCAGYETYLVSAYTGQGIDEIQSLLYHKMTAFAGPSGVGKSSLLSAITGREDLVVGAVSNKIKRGRHTTRHSEIMRLDSDTYVVDTPGFSSLDFEHFEAKDILPLMPDLAAYAGNCRFSSCLHRSEPDCSVKEGLDAGLILEKRYETYCKIVNSILERKR